MKKVAISHLEMVWQEQIEALAWRRPNWILEVSLLPLILVALRFLISLGVRRRTGIHFPVAAVNIQDRTWLVLLATYLFVAVGIYGWIVFSDKKKHDFRWQRIWLYSAFGMVSMLLASLIALDVAFQVFETAETSPEFVAIIKYSALFLYIALLMLCFALAVSKLFQPAVKRGLPLEVKLAVVIPVFIAAFSVLGNLFQSQPGQTGLVVLASLFLLFSFLLVPIWTSGIVYLFMLMWYKIPQNVQNSTSSLDEQEMWLQEIRKWIEPEEKIEGFTIGYIRSGWARIEVVVALTSKYIRIGSMHGGKNISWEEIQRVEWSDSLAQLQIFTRFSSSPLVISVFGKAWKERAKQLTTGLLQIQANAK